MFPPLKTREIQVFEEFRTGPSPGLKCCCSTTFLWYSASELCKGIWISINYVNSSDSLISLRNPKDFKFLRKNNSLAEMTSQNTYYSLCYSNISARDRHFVIFVISQKFMEFYWILLIFIIFMDFTKLCSGSPPGRKCCCSTVNNRCFGMSFPLRS